MGQSWLKATGASWVDELDHAVQKTIQSLGGAIESSLAKGHIALIKERGAKLYKEQVEMHE